jgi:hypothetical protein
MFGSLNVLVVKNRAEKVVQCEHAAMGLHLLVQHNKILAKVFFKNKKLKLGSIERFVPFFSILECIAGRYQKRTQSCV